MLHKLRIALPVFLTLSLLNLPAPVAAQDAAPVADVESESLTGPFIGTGVFKANEGMILKVPLDTASVLNGAYPIDSAGYVTLPVAGRLFVHDKSVDEIASYLGKSMSQYLRDTHVMAIPVVRLTLLGHWQRPGMHYVDPQLSIWDACRLSGGPLTEANIHDWKVMRGSSILPISLLDEYSRGTSLRNAGIRSGDIFVIPTPNPQSGFWYWFRESVTLTAQVAGIVGTTLTAYVTYLIIEDRSN
ncbi:MAG TPA: hypothetical protein VK465_11355 [Fibrobacteria bacterium]|nr:hypothetical protein [Fibrobacteria bacterium]